MLSACDLVSFARYAFSSTGFAGGIQKLLGATGGYLVGYLPCVALVGAAADKQPDCRWRIAAAMLAGTALLYALGTGWFMLQSKRTLAESISLCILPFLPGDAAKIAVAAAASLPLRRALDRLSAQSKPQKKA